MERHKTTKKPERLEIKGRWANPGRNSPRISEFEGPVNRITQLRENRTAAFRTKPSKSNRWQATGSRRRGLTTFLGSSAKSPFFPKHPCLSGQAIRGKWGQNPAGRQMSVRRGLWKRGRALARSVQRQRCVVNSGPAAFVSTSTGKMTTDSRCNQVFLQSPAAARNQVAFFHESLVQPDHGAVGEKSRSPINRGGWRTTADQRRKTGLA